MVNMPIPKNDLTRITLAVFFVIALTGASLWVLRPFLPALIWSTMIVVATWGIMRAVQMRLWGKRALAVAVMTLGLILIFVVPLWLAIGTIVGNIDTIAAWVKTLRGFELPVAPVWLAHIPMLGDTLTSFWNDLATQGTPELLQRLLPYAQKLMQWFVGELGGIGMLTLQFVLVVVISAILYTNGEKAARSIQRFGQRLAGEEGGRVVSLAGEAIRAVALGIVVTALVQSVIGGIGLAIAGVPFAAVLTAIMFLLAIVQIGAAPVMVIATIWLFWHDSYGWGVALVVWTVLVGSLDNILRPLLIRRGADLPLLLIFAGVIGGLIAFGLVGLFIGPVVLAVTYTLLQAWIDGPKAPSPKRRLARVSSK